jgi:hypothetical protein
MGMNGCSRRQCPGCAQYLLSLCRAVELRYACRNVGQQGQVMEITRAASQELLFKLCTTLCTDTVFSKHMLLQLTRGAENTVSNNEGKRAYLT